MERTRKKIFKKGLLVSLLVIFAGLFFYYKSLKSKTDHEIVKGKIDYLDTKFENLKPRDHRFIHLIGYDQTFDIFVGKEKGDFSPEFEQIDKLKIGDDIIVYHSETMKFQNKDKRVNRHVEYIDKDNIPYFIEGNSNKSFAIFFIGLGLILMSTLVILKMNKKIY